MMPQESLFNPLATMNNIRSKLAISAKHPQQMNMRRKSDFIKRGSIKGSSNGGKVVPLFSFGSKCSTVSMDSSESLLHDVNNIMPSSTSNAQWPHQLYGAVHQGKSRPMACPPTVDDTDSKDHGETEELSRIYDSATWRMYYRILSARKRREMDAQVSSMGPRREPISQNSRGAATPGSDELMSDLEKVLDRSSRSSEGMEVPELDDEGIFALELEM